MNYDEINHLLDQIFPESLLRFQDLLEYVLKGQWEALWKSGLQYIGSQIGCGFQKNKQVYISMILLVLVLSVILNFADVFQNQQVTQISFYIVYMLLVAMCLRSFQNTMIDVENRLLMLTEFMRIFCPEYFMLTALSSGNGSGFYQIVLLSIYLVEMIILKWILPMIQIYFMIQVLNNLIGENVFSELGDLTKKIICWSLKGFLGVILGLQTIQGLLSPAMYTLKRGAIQKTVEAIPGIGNVFGSISEVTLATTIVIKNGIGVCGAILILLIGMIPVLQIVFLCMAYKFSVAMLQPVSNRRMIGCIRGVEEGYELLLKVLCDILILFLLTFAIVSVATS